MNQIPTNQLETITPAIAAEYLKHNTQVNASRLSQRDVIRWAKAMERGEWRVSNDNICFNTKGDLTNGQHRLHAVIKSGVSIQVWVQRGVDDDAYTAMDCGKARTGGQLLGMRGVPSSVAVGAIVRLQFSLRRGNAKGHEGRLDAPTNTQIIEEYDKDPEGYNRAGGFTKKIGSRLGRALAFQPSHIGAIYYYLQNDMGYDEPFVASFFEQIFSLSTSENPMLENFRVRLLKERESSSKKTPLRYRANLIAKVWNAYAEGKNIKCIKWSEQEGVIEFKPNTKSIL